MRGRNIKLFNLILLTIIVFASIMLASFGSDLALATNEAGDITLEELVTEMFGDREIISMEYLYNFDDAPDYIYVDCETGYAVYLTDTLELMEYSPTGSLPYKDDDLKKYYNGPGNYFKKKGDIFVNVITNECLELTAVVAQATAKQTLEMFSAKSSKDKEVELDVIKLKKVNKNSNPMQKSSHYPSDSNELENGALPGSAGTKYISNYQYFFNNPTHGLNQSGTCSAIAAQLLLSYNNYYNDRRIIADEHLNGWDATMGTVGDAERNPNYCLDPESMTSQTLGSSGYYESDENTFFNYVIKSIPPSSSTSSTEKGIKNIIAKRNGQIEGTISISTSVKTVITELELKGLKKEIDAGRPAFLSLRSSDTKSNHAVVVYGYQEKNSTLGFITHFGWSEKFNRIWANGAWCSNFLTLQINHTHDYEGKIDVIEDVDPPYIKYLGYVCKECGQRMNPYITEDIGNNQLSITGIKMPFSEVIIPAVINNKAVVSIGDYAFENANYLESVDLFSTYIIKIGKNAFRNSSVKSFGFLYHPYFVDTIEITLKEIGEYAFAGCKDLKSCPIPEKIGDYAFMGCTSMKGLQVGENSKLTTIGRGAFYGCTSLWDVEISNYTTTIGDDAFANCSMLLRVYPSDNSNLTTIGNNAFENCEKLSVVQLPKSLKSIGYNAFKNCPILSFVVLSKNVASIGTGAFAGCDKLTIYTESNYLVSSNVCNPLNRPIVSGCTLYADINVALPESFIKSSTNPTNRDKGINSPLHLYYDFNGWYTTSDLSGTQYNISDAPNGRLYGKWKHKESACISEDTLITLADGSQVAAEDLNGDEELLVWNLFTGNFDTAPILFIDREEPTLNAITRLTFSDGTQVKVIGEHAFFDCDLNKYVYLDDNAARFIGHWFNKQAYDENGNMVWVKVQLLDVENYEEFTTAYSPVTYGHLCYYVNGMLSIPGGILGLFNIFEVDTTTMKIDEEAFNQDIQTYGLYTYEEFAELVPVSEAVFEAFNGQYLKVAVGKGLITIEQLNVLVNRYAEMFPKD